MPKSSPEWSPFFGFHNHNCYAFLISHMLAASDPPILIDLITLILFGEARKL